MTLRNLREKRIKRRAKRDESKGPLRKVLNFSEYDDARGKYCAFLECLHTVQSPTNTGTERRCPVCADHFLIALEDSFRPSSE